MQALKNLLYPTSCCVGTLPLNLLPFMSLLWQKKTKKNASTKQLIRLHICWKQRDISI